MSKLRQTALLVLSILLLLSVFTLAKSFMFKGGVTSLQCGHAGGDILGAMEGCPCNFPKVSLGKVTDVECVCCCCVPWYRAVFD